MALDNKPTDPELERLVKAGRPRAAFRLLQQRRREAPRDQPRRAPFDELLHDLWQLKRQGTSFGAVLALLVGSLLGVALLVLGLSVVGLRVAEWSLFPAIDRLLAIVGPLVFAPGVLPALAVGVFVFGVVIAHKFRSPALFVGGISAVSLGLVCVWLFPWYIRLLQRVAGDAELPLLIVGGVMSLLVFVVGIQIAARAND